MRPLGAGLSGAAASLFLHLAKEPWFAGVEVQPEDGCLCLRHRSGPPPHVLQTIRTSGWNGFPVVLDPLGTPGRVSASPG